MKHCNVFCTIGILSIFIGANALSQVSYTKNHRHGEQLSSRCSNSQQCAGRCSHFAEVEENRGEHAHTTADYSSFNPLPKLTPFKPGPIQHRASLPPFHRSPPSLSTSELGSFTHYQAPQPSFQNVTQKSKGESQEQVIIHEETNNVDGVSSAISRIASIPNKASRAPSFSLRFFHWFCRGVQSMQRHCFGG
eukprot:c53521_g1_i1 orf=98-673(+)